MKVKLLPKVLGFVIVFFGVLYGVRTLMSSGFIPRPSILKSVVPIKAEMESAQVLQHNLNVDKVKLPYGSVSGKVSTSTEIKCLVIPWNAHLGAFFANGGPQTTSGSLMEKWGANVTFERQDDYGKMQDALEAYAQTSGKGGAPCVTIMGDGGAPFLAALNPRLQRINQKSIIVGSFGWSRGEDRFMGPKAWKDDPKASRGGTVAGVLRDGDWNIAMDWLQKNDLANNPDEKTFDPDALNWIATSSFSEAVDKYIAGYCEDRPVKNTPGKTKKVCVDGVVVWTPGDVAVAEKKGGLVSILSTKENLFQMPNAVIMLDSFAKANRKSVEAMFGAAFEGADQVRAFPDALQFAGDVAAKVFNEADGAYWVKYYEGVTEADKTGVHVELGGSAVSNLSDNLQLFGLLPGHANLFKATYTTFGNITKQQYPNLVPDFPAFESVVDTSYIVSLKGKLKENAASTEVTYASSDRIKQVVGRQNWSINFRTGSAEFSPSALSVLEELENSLVISDTVIQIHGHTDNVGNPELNMALSQRRAEAVSNWLKTEAPKNFPSGRMRVYAHGQDDPIAPNTSAANQAKNRRVEVVIGTR